MRIVRFKHGKAVRIGSVQGDVVTVLHGQDGPDLDPDDTTALIDLWSRSGLPTESAESYSLDDVTILVPIVNPRKIVAIGLNYRAHAEEGGAEPPTEPLVFAKFPSALIGDGETITWDARLTDAVDYEAELGVVIGAPARNVRLEDALEHVFGYTCVNDVSARDLQFADGQWVRSKSLDSFCPVGPWITTRDEVGNDEDLHIECVVSGEKMQSATTADMVFSVAELVSRMSRWFTLEAGDLIATGTPPGVGYFRSPRRVLRDGDEVVVEIDRVGRLSNRVRVSQASGR